MKAKILILCVIACTTSTTYATRCIPLPPDAQASAPEKSRLTFDQALTQALSKRSNLKQLQFLTKSQQNNALATLSAYLPNIGINSFFQKAKNGAVPLNQQQITIRQLLFSLAGPVEQYKIAKHATRIAELNELLQRDLVRFETESSFLNLYSLQKRIAPVSTFEVAAIANLQKALLSDKKGLLNAFGIEQEKGTFENSVSLLFNYEEQIMIARSDLKKTLELETPFTIDMLNAERVIQNNLAEVTRYDESFFLEAARHFRKELAIQTEEISRLEKLKQFQEKSYLPSVSLFASILTGEPALSVGLRQLPGNFWSAGLQLSWNFDGLGNAHRAAAEDAALEAAIFAKRDKEFSIEREVSTAYHELQQLNSSLDAACKDLSPEELFFQQKKRYEVGDLSETEYKQAVYEWDKAQYLVTDLQVKTTLKYRELLVKSGYPNIDNPSSTQSIEL